MPNPFRSRFHFSLPLTSFALLLLTLSVPLESPARQSAAYPADCVQKGGNYECKPGTPGQKYFSAPGSGCKSVHWATTGDDCLTLAEAGSRAAAATLLANSNVWCSVTFLRPAEPWPAPSQTLGVDSGQSGDLVYEFVGFQNGVCDPSSAHERIGSGGWSRNVVCETGWAPYNNQVCMRRIIECETCGVGNPIVPSTARKVQTETDFSNAGSALLRFIRTYRSEAFELARPTASALAETTQVPVFGANWHHNFQQRIAVDTSGSVSVAYFYDERGEKQIFRLIGGVWRPLKHRNETLQEIPGATGPAIRWVHTARDNLVHQFDSVGLLRAVVDPSGRSVQLAYTDGTASGSNGAVLVGTSTPVPMGFLLRVTDSFGRTLVFDYRADLLLDAVVTPDGNVTFEYDSGRRLSKASYPGSQFRQYRYNNNLPPSGQISVDMLLTSILDENGVEYARFTYDTANRAKTTEYAGGVNKYEITYGWSNSPSSSTFANDIKEPNSVVKNRNVKLEDGIYRDASTTQPCSTPGCIGLVTRSIDYHASPNTGFVLARTDFGGSRTCYGYDFARALETARIEGLTASESCVTQLAAATLTLPARRISTAWSSTQQVPVTIAEPKRRTTLKYHGDPGVSCAPLGASTLLLCEKRVEATTDATGAQGFSATLDATVPARVWTWTYNAAGQVLTANDPPGNVTTYTYHSSTTASVTQGDLASITSAVPALGVPAHVTQFTEYDAAGRLKKMIDPNGLETTLTYYPRGWLASRTVGSNTGSPETTNYTYDNVGQLTFVTQPDGSTIQYHYDAAHRLWKISDGLGHSITYTLDNMGNRTAEQYRDGSGQLARSLTREYDALNRIKYDRGGSTPTPETQYGYDNQGNLKKITDPLTRVTDNDYDALNRLIKVTDAQTPTRGITEYGYDGQDNLTTVKDPKGLTTTYTYSGLGDLKTQVSPDTGTTTFTHDVAGNVLTKTDARSVTATYTYDALNRVTTISYPAVGTDPAETVTYVYDTCTNGKGRLCSLTDKTGTTTYTYDQKGRVTAKSQTNGSLTQTVGYGYNSAGQLTTMTYPSGRVVTYTYTNGRPVSVAVNGKTVLNSAVYEPFGPLGGWHWGNSTPQAVNAHLRILDLDYRAISVQSDHVGLGPRVRDLTWNLASAITAITEPGNPLNSYTYGYDTVDRLTSVTPVGQPQQYGYSYDLNGNRLTSTDTGATTNYSYPSPFTSHKLTGLTGAQAKSFTYDAIGNMTGDGSNLWRYGGNNRPYEIVTPGGTVSVAINALGQRIKKAASSSATRFMYDEAGRLIGEYDDAGNRLKEHVWFGDLPVAVIP